ncbi:hypothetical protein BZG36_03131 [Bifiguratus adelaidae]|uniref:Hexaprenyl pyrophosphate synthase, mitochondrial n=1 Tax=Bifiguratus adelaidae TaxID=1938954 RepID=A0A261XXA1_9FUNG|nr:hypothetical protein BZG36_03131 [Bifiguratus adelaidae]
MRSASRKCVTLASFSFGQRNHYRSLHLFTVPRLFRDGRQTTWHAYQLKVFPRTVQGINASTWTQAVQRAQELVEEPKVPPLIDAAKLVGPDFGLLKRNIASLLGSGHPLLNTVSNYYFSAEGKNIRPLLVLLISQATSKAAKSSHDPGRYYDTIDIPVSSTTLSATKCTSRIANELYMPRSTKEGCEVLPTQRRLAEITEMIHTASLLHDDVIDVSESRRNLPSANANFGNKMAILGGDFLLARASIALARLRHPEVIELMASSLANLVEGEFMQIKDFIKNKDSASEKGAIFQYYLKKSYMKTGSLIAKSCKSAALLGGCTKDVCDIAHEFAYHLGLAFQLVDDMLDFTATSDQFGKPAGADLKLGLATAPVLFAWEEYPELGALIERKFKMPGDVEKARMLVYESNGLAQTKSLAEDHCQKAIDIISVLPDSEAKTALIQLTQKVVSRKR